MAGRRREENLESKIIIRNYPLDTDDRDLRIMFEKYGKIEDCKWNVLRKFSSSIDLKLHLSILHWSMSIILYLLYRIKK